MISSTHKPFTVSPDHIAVIEFIEEKVLGLTLHLPTSWQQEVSSPCFLDNQDHNIYRNPGRSANKLHKQFTSKIGEDTLKQIQSAVHLGANYHVHDGFKERNSAVAKESDYLVAFTWNDGKAPKEESGTYDTWKKHRGTKLHIPISSLPGVGGHKSLPSFFPGRGKPSGSAVAKPAGKGESTESYEDSADSGCCCSSSLESLQSSEPLQPLQTRDCEPLQCSGGEAASLGQVAGKGELKGDIAVGLKRERGALNSGTSPDTKKHRLA